MSFANNPPALLARLAARFPRLAERYLCLDPRSLGLARIYLGLLLLTDLLRRVPDLRVWYTNDGLLPNHTVLWRPGAQYQLSFFFGASSTGEVAVLFFLCGLVFFCFLIGWKTRLFHALSVICIVSLHDRVIFLENGGDVVLNILCVWTLFLPMGARFSVDAWLASLRGGRERALADLERREDLAAETRPVLSLAVLALLLQVSVIYYFNFIHKSGETWREGSAVHYALHQDRVVTWLGWKLRPHLTLTLSRVLTYSSLVLEALAPLLVLNPFAWRTTRWLAVLLLPGLHIGFAALLNLGLFSFNMIGFIWLLIPGSDWDRLLDRLRPKQPRVRTVTVDDRNGLCWLLARVCARLDRYGQLRFLPRPRVGPEPGRADDLRVDEEGGPSLQGVRAVASLLGALPLGGPLAAIIRAPLCGALLERGYRTLARGRGSVSAWLGLPAAQTPGDRAEPATGEPALLRLWLARHAARGREIAVVLLLIALGSQVLIENRAVPTSLKLGQVRWMRMVVEYPRLFQGWSMFAPDAPRDDLNVFVDAVTSDGRHVDPLNERGSRVAPPTTDVIPEFLDQDEYFCDYIQRIPGHGAYHPPLSDWIQGYHRRTRRPEDRITSFEVYQITDLSPPPGQTQPRDVKKTLLFSWPPLN